MNQKPTYSVSFDQEICCEVCCEVVHFHIEKCPVCNKKHASTNQFHSVKDCIDSDEGIFTCTNCDSVFKILKYDIDNDPEAVIQLLNTVFE